MTQSGARALFPSVRLCRATASGRPDIAAPLILLEPYEGSADGPNIVPIDLTVTEQGQTFFWVIEFPRRSKAGPDQPFVRVDLADLDAGFFGATYDITPAGLASAGGGGNLGVALTCELRSPDLVPLSAPSNLGVNWRGGNFDFSFRPSTDTSVPAADLRQTVLMLRGDFGPWRPFSATGRGSNQISVPIDSIPGGAKFWATASRDKRGNLSGQSSVVIAIPVANNRSDFTYDAFEPNGSRNQASFVPRSGGVRFAAIYPAGDRDFYQLEAEEGEVIHASAGAGGFSSLLDHLRLAVALFDVSGKLVALSDGSATDTPPRIDFLVPRRAGAAVRHKFTLEVLDPRGNWVVPGADRRSGLNTLYTLIVTVDASETAIAETSPPPHEPKMSAEPSPEGGVEFRIVLPVGITQGSGSGVLQVFDVRGRLIRALRRHANGTDQELRITWDGRRSDGDPVISGVYFARFISPGYSAARKVVITR